MRPTICLGDRLTAIAKNECPPTWCNALLLLRGKNNTLALSKTIEAPLHVGASLVRIALCHALLTVPIACFEVVVRISRHIGTAARAIAKEVVAGGHLCCRHGKALAHLRPTVCLGDRLTAIAKHPTGACCCCGAKITH